MIPRCPAKEVGFIDLAFEEGELGREDTQGQWHRTIAQALRPCTVLDVGAGLCESIPRFMEHGHRIMTQDLFPDSKADFKCMVQDMPGKCFDAVVCFDVIEHVENYTGFMFCLRHIAKRHVAISTPNYYVTQNTHRYHIREFCPDELPALGDELGLKLIRSWCQLPGRGVFETTRSELEACVDTHGYLLIFKV